MHNLVDNALRHGGGSTVITISAARRQDRVRIGVDDRGPGFPPAPLTRVFDPFTRGPQPAEQQARAGLGLAIVSAVAKAHGGVGHGREPGRRRRQRRSGARGRARGPRLAGDGQGRRDGGAVAGTGADLPGAAGHLDLLSHAGETEVAPPEVVAGGVG